MGHAQIAEQARIKAGCTAWVLRWYDGGGRQQAGAEGTAPVETQVGVESTCASALVCQTGANVL